MRKGEATKQEIIRRVAPVFNRQGFAGASLSDIMAATGLHKGGIYNHFDSKEQLALEAFDYAADLMRLRWERTVDGMETAAKQLEALIVGFRSVYSSPEVAGGCPLLNTAIDSDDTNPPLRGRVSAAFEYWQDWIASIVRQGQTHGEFRQEANAEDAAAFIISALEGALMLSQVRRNPAPLQAATAQLANYVQRDLAG